MDLSFLDVHLATVLSEITDSLSSGKAASVFQALYLCGPFRELLLQYLRTLRSLLGHILLFGQHHNCPRGRSPSASARTPHFHKPTTSSDTALGPRNPVVKGTVAHRAFIDRLKDLRELFRSSIHQDVHEFLIYLLNRDM